MAESWDGFAIRPDGLQNRPTRQSANLSPGSAYLIQGRFLSHLIPDCDSRNHRPAALRAPRAGNRLRRGGAETGPRCPEGEMKSNTRNNARKASRRRPAELDLVDRIHEEELHTESPDGDFDEHAAAGPATGHGTGRDEALSLYLREMGAIPMLKRTEELALAR